MSKSYKETLADVLEEQKALRAYCEMLHEEVKHLRGEKHCSLIDSRIRRLEGYYDLFSFAANDLGYFKVTGTRYGRKGFFARLFGAKGAS